LAKYTHIRQTRNRQISGLKRATGKLGGREFWTVRI
jgi:hypothetical protein